MKLHKSLFTLLVATIPALLSAQQQHYVGGDISLLPRYEQYNTPYYTQSGEKIDDVLLYMRDECKLNAMRVRLFVNPNPSEAKDGVVQDLEYVTALGQRIKEAGLQFMLDFHYSDTWADPVSQKLPATWSDCTTPAQKAERLYQYTTDCLTTLNAANATPDFVQVGNEISYGMVGIQVHPYDKAGDDWEGLLTVLTQGCRAVRECCPEAKIIIHTERAAKATDTEYFYQKLTDLDYDIIGLSYYPIWHAPVTTLSGTLTMLATSFPSKQVQIVETAYNYEWWPSSGVTYDTRNLWPCSPEGQQLFLQDLIAELKQHENVNGLYWWFPEENGNGGPTWNASTIVISSWIDRGLWNNNTHRALPALYDLQSFRTDDASLPGLNVLPASSHAPINAYGQRVSRMQSGEVYILDGKKVILQ